MGYAENAMREVHGQGGGFSTTAHELERRGQEIADAMGRYRGTEPLIEAVKRLARDYDALNNPALNEVAKELASARATHASMNSHHEGYAVILEELDELWEVCKTNTHSFAHERPKWAHDIDLSDKASLRRLKRKAMRREAIQIAAMAIRFIEDVCDKD